MSLVLRRERAVKRVNNAATIPSDSELIEAAQSGDDAAFASLVERYTGRVYALVGGMVRDRLSAEDIVQDVFFKVHLKLPTFEGKSRFYTWLYRVAYNTATDHLKKKRLDKSHSVEDFSYLDLEACDTGPERRMATSELRRRLADAVAELPEKYRDILVLREYEECSYEEIAEILQCSKGTVESRLFRARARLKEKLKGFLT